MTDRAKSLFSIALPAALFVALSAGIASTLGLGLETKPSAIEQPPATVAIPPHDATYRQEGEFYRNGFAVDAPLLQTRFTSPLTIMKYQVSEADYAGCVHAGACAPLDQTTTPRKDRPATGVSHDDAVAYAAWLSRTTSMVWRLPTDAELAMAAGSKFPDDALGVDGDSRNPALRWLADYDRETRRKAVDPKPQAYGHFGENEFGLSDFAGNVWEWTSTCHRRVDLAAGGSARTDTACGIYITVGRHRSPMSSFVREPKSGGCAVGTPPANLGFRLVRDERLIARVKWQLHLRGIDL